MPPKSPRNNGDPVALRSPAMCRFFAPVMQRQMRQGFRAVRLAGPALPELPEGRAVIVYANHPSWWDPVFCMVLALRLFPGHESYGPMEAAMLERYRFMKRIGIFGVEPGTRAGAAAFLRTAQHILSDPSRMLWITAQGEFRDPRDRPIRLRGGIAHLMARMPEATALPLALEYPFWSEKRPEALAAFGAPIEARGGVPVEVWQHRLEAGLQATMDDLAARAAARDPAGFERILGGRAGVGGVYGGWGRIRAALRGERYVPDHMAEER